MRHFTQLRPDVCERLFHLQPEEFTDTDAQSMSAALGATIYCPATRPQLAADIDKLAAQGVVSVVVCLEDSVPDVLLEQAEENLVQQLASYAASIDEHTSRQIMVFIRVRSVEQLRDLIPRLDGALAVLSGFVLPKFGDPAHQEYFALTDQVAQLTGRQMFVMPVLETPDLIRRSTRHRTLDRIEELLGEHHDQVLAIRTGATDFSAAYGLRRPADTTVYDIQVVKDVLTDVLNTFAIADGSGYTVTGPVWEYFDSSERVLRSQLRETPFQQHAATSLRKELMRASLDGLIKEIQLDKANGFTGKTVIHPTHVAAVHALSVVTHEEYSDACDVLGSNMASGGVAGSQYRNKMNEAKPHRPWAERVVRRARAFGVAREEISYVDVLAADMDS